VTEPLIRDGGELRPVSWERAIEEAIGGLRRAGSRTGAIVGGQATSEEGFLLARVVREALGSAHVDSRAAGTLPLDLQRALGDPRLQARVSDLEFAHAVLVLDCEPITDAPILDLRLRKGARRHGMKLAHAASSEPRQLREALEGLSREGQEGGEIVILWGERLADGPGGAEAARALLQAATMLSLGEIDGAGLLEVPAGANGRGLREAGVLPNALAGLAPAPEEGMGALGMADALIAGELDALYLLRADPLSDGDPLSHAQPHGELPLRALWDQALRRASTVVAHAMFLSDGVREHADVVFPAQAYAEKEGTITHPDGRLQRLRPAVARPGSIRAEWLVIDELAAGLGLALGVDTATDASRQLFDAVPFYAGLTLEEIGGRGVRWQERPQASAYGAELATGERA
jgi:NADH-quinone oxidoreductase subunit G